MKKYFLSRILMVSVGLSITLGSFAAFVPTTVAQTKPALAVTVSKVDIFDTSVTIGGKLATTGLTNPAIVYGADTDPLPTSQPLTVAADGTFLVSITGFEPLKTYYYQFRATDPVSGAIENAKAYVTTKATELNFQITKITAVKAAVEGSVQSSTNPDILVQWGLASGTLSETFTPAIKSDKTFSEDVTDLLPDTAYQVVIVRASKPTQQLTGVRIFHTYPVTASAYASNVSATSATIAATVTEGAQSLSVTYSTSEKNALSQEIPMQKGTDNVYTAQLKNLKPATLYIYAIRVTSPGGTKDTPTYSFSTQATPPKAGVVQTITDTIGGNTVIGNFKGGLVPCEGVDASGTATCGFKDIIALIGKIIQFCLVVVAPIIVTALALYGGILYLTQGNNEASRTKANGLFKRALLGFLIALGAWLIIKSLLIGIGYDSTLFPTFFTK